MDLRVHLKENIQHDSITDLGSEQDGDNIIDIYPEYSEDGQVVVNAEILEDNAEIAQACILNTLFQRGLDPVEPTVGVRWSEVLLEEISPITFMDDITKAAEEVSTAAKVTFDTVNKDGVSYLKYSVEVQD